MATFDNVDDGASVSFRQAKEAAHDYMRQARDDIDKIFDEPGYAKANPALVAAYMQVAAIENATSFGLHNISRSLAKIADRIEFK